MGNVFKDSHLHFQLKNDFIVGVIYYPLLNLRMITFLIK
jgi:hypothetical protein